MPINRKFNLNLLLGTLREELQSKHKYKVLFEYVMLAGVNDRYIPCFFLQWYFILVPVYFLNINSPSIFVRCALVSAISLVSNRSPKHSSLLFLWLPVDSSGGIYFLSKFKLKMIQD